MALGKLFPHCMKKRKKKKKKRAKKKNAAQSSLELPIPHVRHVPEVVLKASRDRRDGEWWLNAR